jgi:DNA-binding transcriptional LysR family regulator
MLCRFVGLAHELGHQEVRSAPSRASRATAFRLLQSMNTNGPMLEIKQLKIFRTVVEVGSFTGAGDQLGLSQPAISQQVRTLEETLGVPLLVRAGRGARPTPAGDVLFQCARQMIDRLEEIERHFAEETAGRAGVVRLGAPEPPCSYLLPAALVALRRELPKVDLRVASGQPATTLARLAGGDIDVALVPMPVESERFRVIEVGSDEMVAVMPPEHRWAARARVDATDFATEPLVLYDRTSAITEATLAFLLEGGVFPSVAIEIDQLEAVKELVRAGVGVAVVPRWAARREIAAGALTAVSVGAHGLRRTWALVFPDAQPRPATIASVVRLLAEELPARFG